MTLNPEEDDDDTGSYASVSTISFDIESMSPDSSRENSIVVKTKTFTFRLERNDCRASYILVDVKKRSKNIFQQVTSTVAHHAGHSMNAVKDHPITMGVPLAVAGVGLGATAIGFGAAGIVGGSIAAAIQSSIGNVAAGSLFATMQSAGATGCFSAMTTCGLGVTATSATVAAVQGKKGDTEQSPEEILEESTSEKNSEGYEKLDRAEPPEDRLDGKDTECKKESLSFEDVRKFIGLCATISEDMLKLLVHCFD